MRTASCARELAMMPLEVIVRNIAAGSMVKNYPVRERDRLDPPVIIIDYKDDTRHDPMLNDDLIVALNLATVDELAALKKIALRVNKVISDYLWYHRH